ncbi:MAG: tRNA (uridine(34)/cytosine(34)/5-carboxymethylaminomethyluridine(34)-2'-O)-methyltransferase TrmL [Blastopirellula sp.]|nr:MAG: tRNA (uridine(34)/cytosine(34)/5-carboxymethylaminomethyluridine(34)-2'-O)-methyltransferase TrmL [Blastopirellula sp.]
MNYDPLFHIVLLEPEIPPNTGNIGRTCVATGVKLWLVKPLGFSVADKDLKRAGMDYWKHLEWEVVDNWQHLQQRLPDTNFWYFTKTSKKPYTAVSYQPGDALVFGAESKGLPKDLMSENQDNLLSVPMRTQVRSLNLSTTAGIVAYEAVRQITLAGEASLPIGESPC